MILAFKNADVFFTTSIYAIDARAISQSIYILLISYSTLYAVSTYICRNSNLLRINETWCDTVNPFGRNRIRWPNEIQTLNEKFNFTDHKRSVTKVVRARLIQFHFQHNSTANISLQTQSSKTMEYMFQFTFGKQIKCACSSI